MRGNRLICEYHVCVCVHVRAARLIEERWMNERAGSVQKLGRRASSSSCSSTITAVSASRYLGNADVSLTINRGEDQR